MAAIGKMQISNNNPDSNPPGEDTIIYDDAERGVREQIDDVFSSKNNGAGYSGNPTYYGSIPVYENRFGEQVGGGSELSTSGMDEQAGDGPDAPAFGRYTFRRNIPLTPKAQHCHEALKAAQHRSVTVPRTPTPTPQPPQHIEHDDFLDGLSAETIAGLAHDHTSNFEMSPESSEDAPAPVGGNAPVHGGEVQPRWLLEDFFQAGEFKRIQLPSGPRARSLPLGSGGAIATSNAVTFNATTTSTVTTSTVSSSPPATTSCKSAGKVANSSAPALDTPPPKHSSPGISPGVSPSVGRLSSDKLNYCNEKFSRIRGLFAETAQFVGRPTEVVQNWFFSSLKGSRSPNAWNMYQTFFANHREEELERCNLEEGTDVDCWPSFQEQHRNGLEAFLRAALDLDRMLTQKQTFQQRSRSFTKYCGKMEKLIDEGAANRFQSFSIIVGDCVNEDKGLGVIYTSPGLENVKLLKNRLKLNHDTMLGLARCEAYDVVSEKITETFDAEQLVKELNKALDAAEAVLKPPSTPLEERDNDNDLVMEDEANPISGCKDRIIALLKSATEAAGQTWEKDRLPWGTLPKYLVGISHVITGWPASCPFPHETIKPKRSKRSAKEGNSQGIKDLGTKHSRVLLTALQGDQVKLVKTDYDKIVQNSVPVIATSLPTDRDPPLCLARSLFANGEVVLGQAAVKSSAATRIKRKKVAQEVISIESDTPSPKPATAASKPPAAVQKPSKTNRRCHVEVESADSDSDRPTPPAKKKQSTKRIVAVVSSDFDDNPKNMKRRRLSPTDSENDTNAIGSGDDYIDDQGDDMSEAGLKVSPRHKRWGRTGAKGKGTEKPTSKASLAVLPNAAAPSTAITKHAPAPPTAPASASGADSHHGQQTKVTDPTAAPDAPVPTIRPHPRPRPLVHKPTAPVGTGDTSSASNRSHTATQGGAQTCTQRPQCGQDIVNSFPPLTLRRSQAPSSMNTLPPAQAASVDDSLERGRAVTLLPYGKSTDADVPSDIGVLNNVDVFSENEIHNENEMPDSSSNMPDDGDVLPHDMPIDNYSEEPMDSHYGVQMYHRYSDNSAGYDMAYSQNFTYDYAAPPPGFPGYNEFAHPPQDSGFQRPPSTHPMCQQLQYQPGYGDQGATQDANISGPPRAFNSGGPPRAHNASSPPHAPNTGGPPRAPNTGGPPHAPSTTGGLTRALNATSSTTRTTNPTSGPTRASNTTGGPPHALNTTGGQPCAPNTIGGLPRALHTTGGPPRAPHTTGGLPHAPHTTGGPPRAPHTTGRLPRAPHTTGRPPHAPNTTGGPPRAPNTTGRPPRAPNTTGGPPRAPNTTGGPPRAPNTTGRPPHAPNTTGRPPRAPNTGSHSHAPNTSGPGHPYVPGGPPHAPNASSHPRTPNTGGNPHVPSDGSHPPNVNGLRRALNAHPPRAANVSGASHH
ncbi:hypothetical protein C0993_011000, partial [Termitomyces sp. T159_Od127]